MTALTQAERLLQELGVTEPKEIDVEAIAYHVNARVRYRPLEGCEARIVGAGDRAIITINENSIPRRKRFSIAHELGHWRNHRGQCLVCRAEDYSPRNAMTPEKVADAYAADLLLPNYLFQPIARQFGKLNFKSISSLSDIFETSKTATGIRLINSNHSSALLVCHGRNGRKWFVKAPSVPSKWFPRNDLDAESFAMNVLFGNAPEDANPRKIGADAWFDRRDAERYEVHEQTIRVGPEEILTLVLIGDAAMLDS